MMESFWTGAAVWHHVSPGDSCLPVKVSIKHNEHGSHTRYTQVTSATALTQAAIVTNLLQTIASTVPIKTKPENLQTCLDRTIKTRQKSKILDETVHVLLEITLDFWQRWFMYEILHVQKYFYTHQSGILIKIQQKQSNCEILLQSKIPFLCEYIVK